VRVNGPWDCLRLIDKVGGERASECGGTTGRARRCANSKVGDLGSEGDIMFYVGGLPFC
jgi:hypothetical protein